MNITFNPKYVLKKDEGCVLLLSKKGLADETDFEESVNAVIHPFHAMVLSMINGDDYDVTLNKIAKNLNIPLDKTKKFIDSLIENDRQTGIKYNDTTLAFPKNSIIKSNFKRNPSYSISEFEYNYLDLQIKRHKTPSTLTLMINNKCSTNCIYCYADKRRPVDCKIPFNRIKELLVEAKELGVISFDLIGGEIFLYKEWKKLLCAFYENGFEPFLSTKYPLTEDDVKFLKSIGLPFIQISLDTMLSEHLAAILKVNNEYKHRIIRTFEYLNKYDIKVVVHTIVTNINDSCNDMLSIFNFLNRYSNIRYWLPEIAGPSIYTGDDDFDLFKARRLNIIELQKLIDKYGVSSNYKIINGFNKLEEFEETSSGNFKYRLESFINRGLCSGNFSHMYILPTGDVTICEELYWHPKFIIGNVLKQGLYDIWTSEKALKLYNISQNDIKDDSTCAFCEYFEECRVTKQICYRDVIKAYGKDKWYYPDPNCPKAPQPYNSIKL